MYTQTQLKKIDRICRMILEVANGNFSYRIARSDHADHLERIIVSLNMMTEEIRESFNHFALINPRETYNRIGQMTFILDRDFHILNFNTLAQQMLEIDELVKGRPLIELLSPESCQPWEQKIEEIRARDSSEDLQTLRLVFNSPNTLTLPSLCSLSSMALTSASEKAYVLTALQILTQSAEKEKKIQNALKSPIKRNNNHTAIRRETDKKKIQEIYDYILENLERPLPSLKELAHQHGINEYKLKIGFRQIYNTSVFRFQKDQRLKRAHNFIMDSDLSLTRIADICGFKSFPHFSKIFKKKYGYNPSEVRKKDMNL